VAKRLERKVIGIIGTCTIGLDPKAKDSKHTGPIAVNAALKCNERGVYRYNGYRYQITQGVVLRRTDGRVTKGVETEVIMPLKEYIESGQQEIIFY